MEPLSFFEEFSCVPQEKLLDILFNTVTPIIAIGEYKQPDEIG